MALVTAKIKIALLKRLIIPLLELCGAQLLADLLTNVRKALSIDLNHVYACTIVLHWLDGSPRHVPTETNPADCAS